ncbi:unnamed protein product, partial [Rotaria sp. Silwood1]
KDPTNVIKNLQHSNKLTFFREREAITTNESLKHTTDNVDKDEDQWMKYLDRS